MSSHRDILTDDRAGQRSVFYTPPEFHGGENMQFSMEATKVSCGIFHGLSLQMGLSVIRKFFMKLVFHIEFYGIFIENLTYFASIEFHRV